ncbi:SNF1 protein kinase subunit beta-3 [Trichoderma lentiforme]|uniref:SNF1 protein kinase subunit beta-3 n=1 Tax=Trichoderma lentiforme TaxID=1567552 RepID=A0A9P5CDW3_9HYPO|nr:SNF1 protein kinase subunit beta-3 [Trichoderma lentiforme]
MTNLEYDEVDPEDTGRLRDVALACKKYLQGFLKDEEAQDDTVNAREGYWASHQCAEFNLWCTKVGVHGEGLRAIDVRLKDVPGIFELLKQLLLSLKRDLEELQQPVRPPEQVTNIHNSLEDAQSDSSSLSFISLSSSDKSEADGAIGDPASSASEKCNAALKRHIEDTIERLHGHAVLIDSAGSRHRRERIELYRQKEGPKWAYEGYRRLANQAVKTYFPSASEAFRQRIGESFARRRIRFEYLVEHQKKRVVNAVATLPQPSPSTVPSQSKDPDGLTHLSKPQETANYSSQHVPQDQHTIYSATVNTKLDMQPQARRQERADSVASVALRRPDFPPPPQLCDKANSFQCPYCRLEFRACEARSDRWSQHVMQDFEPYFCILEECKEPFDVPNSFDGLLDHLQGHLEEQYHIDMPDGEHKEFDETEFEEHLAQHGRGKISTEVVSIMKKASRRKGPFLFRSCPFCGGYPDVIEKRFPNLDTPAAQKELRNHVKQHMQDIALFLPPYRDDISKEDDNLKSSVVTGQNANLDDLKGQSLFLEICDKEDCDCRGPGRPVEAVLADELAAITVEQDLNNTDILRELTIPADLVYEDTASWVELFPNSAPYDHSPVPDEYFLADEHLQSFIARLSPPSANYLRPESAVTNEPSESTSTKLSRVSQGCMKSLAFSEMNAGFDSVDTAARCTCEWPLEDKKWLDWLSCNQGLFWINGKPGTGKSTLLKHLLEKFRLIFPVGANDIVFSFFFSHSGVKLQRTPFGLYRSLVYQIVEQIPDLLPDLTSRFEQRRDKSEEPGEKWQWHPKELRNFLHSALLRLARTRPVWLFIDSLDACGEKNATNLTQQFKSLVQALSGSSGRFHVCLTCRGYLNLDPDNTLQICLENQNRGDVLRYIQEEFSTSPMLSSSDIMSFIIENARGVFTLTRLLVDQALDLERKGITLDAIEEEMNSIRPILQLYHNLIERRGLLSWPFRTIDEAIVQLLIDDDAEAFFNNASSQTPLSWARARGHKAAVKMLIEKNVERESNTPLPIEEEIYTAGESPDDDDYPEPFVDKTRPVVAIRIEWRGGGEKIWVIGTIFHWNRKLRLHPVEGQPGVFAATIHVLPGTHHIRFLVDGIVQTSPELPTTIDFGNELVNYIEVKPDDVLVTELGEVERFKDAKG